jgi:uncharacterized Fe-S cluster protein YjdI
MEKKIEYSNGEVTIIWKPELCKHAGVCVRMLPDVYFPKERPWIRPHGASTGKIIEQVGKCPSGALTYRLSNERG